MLATRHRSRSRVPGAASAEHAGAAARQRAQLRGGLGRLFAVAEAYPELKTNEQFLNLQTRISALENAIADRREFYNETVNINNVRIEQFPDVHRSRGMFDFPPRQLLEFQ